VNIKNSKSYYIKSTSSFKINIKKSYKSKYKINSINVKYTVYEKNSYNIKKYTYKNFTVKNRDGVKLKDINNNIRIEKITINYSTKSKLKKESINSWSPRGKWRGVTYFYGEKSKGILKQKGHIKKIRSDVGVGWEYASTNHEFKVSTKNKKHKINKIKIVFLGFKDTIEGIKTYNAYGKNSLTITSYGKYEGSWIYGYRVYYY